MYIYICYIYIHVYIYICYIYICIYIYIVYIFMTLIFTAPEPVRKPRKGLDWPCHASSLRHGKFGFQLDA